MALLRKNVILGTLKTQETLWKDLICGSRALPGMSRLTTRADLYDT